MANVCLRSFFYRDYVPKVSPFPRRGLFSVSQSFICAAFSLRQNSTSRRESACHTRKKKKISSSIWRVLPNYITSGFLLLFPFLFPSAQFFAYWIWNLLSHSIRGRLNIPVKPLHWGVGMYMDLSRRRLGIKLPRMAQIKSLTNSPSIGSCTLENMHISCRKWPLFLNNKGQRKCVTQRSDDVTGCVWLVQIQHVKGVGSECLQAVESERGEAAGGLGFVYLISGVELMSSYWTHCMKYLFLIWLGGD